MLSGPAAFRGLTLARAFPTPAVENGHQVESLWLGGVACLKSCKEVLKDIRQVVIFA